MFREWLESELAGVVGSLQAIPLPKRKGDAVATLRKRARDLENVLQFLNQFEMAHPANQKTQQTSDNSAISDLLQ